MADKITLEVVTPKGRALSESVDEVTAPSVNGEFGVLPGHLPLVAVIRPGIVSYKQGNETKRVAVGGGFAEAGANKLVILSDEFADRASIDPVIVRKELDELGPKIEKLLAAAEQTADVESDTKAAINQENWLAVKLELYGEAPPPTMRPFEQWGPPPEPYFYDEQETSEGDA